jgi:DNA modification methylase
LKKTEKGQGQNMKQIKTISIKCETKDYLKLEDMTVMQGNLKLREEADYEKIKKSILTYSFSFPFFIWRSGKTNYLIDGTGRHDCLLKMQSEGYLIPELPVVYIQCKNKAEAKQKLLRLNSQYGKMTKESVLEFAEDIDLNFDEIALPDSVIDFTDAEEPQETEGDDEAPEVDEKSEPVSKRGEMYELGNSILMCGDSTDAEDVARLMGGEKASLVLTDPPYGISVVQSNSVGGLEQPTFGTVGGGKVCKVHTYEKIIGDETTETAKKSFEIYSELSDNQIIFGGNYFTDFLPPSRCWLVWDKENTGNFADAELAWTSFDKGVKLYKHLWNGMSREGNRTDEGKTRVHPTQKPVGLLQKILNDFTEKGDVVLDVFGGSGSTLIACEGTGRKCLMIEMSENYCDVIRRRYTKWCLANNRPLTSGCLQ